MTRGTLAGAIAVIACGPVLAEGWVALDGEDIAAALTDRLATHEDTGATQRFKASGRTLHTYGEPSWGSWCIEADQYCSWWPPSPEWDCCELALGGDLGIAFIDLRGNEVVGVIAAE